MKSIVQEVSVLFALAALTAFASGCSSPKAVKSTEAAASSMSSLADNLEKGRLQVTKVMTSLNDLVAAANDPGKAYKSYSSEVASLDKVAADTKARAEKMKATVKEHYALWEQELSAINNPDLKQQGIDRRAQLMKEFEDIKESFLQVRLSFGPYLKNLQDLERYLATDLSASGISGASGTIAKLKEEAVVVQRDIQAAAGKIRSLQASMGKAQK